MFNSLNNRLFKIKKAANPHCRNGCNKLETIDHVLFHCRFYSPIRNEIKKLCSKTKLKFNLANLLVDKQFQLLMEKFLLKVHI